MGREVADFGLPLAAESYLLLLGPEVTYLLLILLPKPLHVLPGLLQQVPLPPQLPIFPSQHVHVILQLSLVTQEPAVEGAKTPQKHLALTNFSPIPHLQVPQTPGSQRDQDSGHRSQAQSAQREAKPREQVNSQKTQPQFGKSQHQKGYKYPQGKEIVPAYASTP